MVGYLPHCTFNLNPRAASIDTPLHAFVPKPHVDHMHPDAIIAIAAAKNSQALTEKIFGGEIGWLPWKRPGFELGLWLEKFCRENPDANGVVLESHGLFTWGDTAKDCYETTIRIINRAIEWFESQTAGKPAFGGEARKTLPAAERRAIAARLMPAIRGMISADERKVGHFDDQPGGAGIRRARRTWSGWPRSAPAAPTISCGPKSGRWSSTSIRPSRMSTTTLAGLPAAIERLPRRLCRLLRPLQARRIRLPCATRTRWSTWCPASA